MRCTRCGKALEKLDWGGRPTITIGSLPTLYNGVICDKCGKIECGSCKPGPSDAPCSWCGSQVSPAMERT
jgi:hypothetical protein